MKTEIFKPIEGYEGLYEVSNFGNVKSNYTNKILKSLLTKSGYLYVMLCKTKSGSRKKNFRIHQLVAKAFIPNPEDYPYVNHIDNNPLNNCVDNLEWCTPKMNSEHAKQIGVISFGETHHKAKLTSEQVIEIKTLYGQLSERKIAKLFNVGRSTIRNILVGNNWKHIK